MRFLPIKMVCLLLGLALAPLVWAHSGGLDKNGCHTNRKTGDYHCHRSREPSPPPAVSHLAEPALSMTPSRSTPASRPFRNCAEARVAWAAPFKRGDAWCGLHLDRD